MNGQPNLPEHPKDTVRRSETERRGIIDNIPATADQGMKLLAQPDDYDQRADLHSLNSMIAIPMEIGRFLPCLLYTSPSPRDLSTSRMPSSA